jgi:hypothetical protein
METLRPRKRPRAARTIVEDLLPQDRRHRHEPEFSSKLSSAVPVPLDVHWDSNQLSWKLPAPPKTSERLEKVLLHCLTAFSPCMREMVLVSDTTPPSCSQVMQSVKSPKSTASRNRKIRQLRLPTSRVFSRGKATRV